MKIAIISDVHIDNNPWNWTEFDSVDADVSTIIVAGDISNNVRITSNWIKEVKKRFENVIWVAGNHDFYNSGFHATRLYNEFEKEWPYPSNVNEIYDHYTRWSIEHGIHFLHRSSVVIDGNTFIGATGWHDFVAGGQYTIEQQIEAWAKYLNDSKYTNWGKLIDHQSVINAAIADSEAIQDMVDIVDDINSGPIIVITHHIPRREFAATNPADIIWTQLNGSFVNTLLEPIVSPNIKLWVYGHTHYRGMATVNDITYLCNARGYRKENAMWEPVIIDV